MIMAEAVQAITERAKSILEKLRLGTEGFRRKIGGQQYCIKIHAIKTLVDLCDTWMSGDANC